MSEIKIVVARYFIAISWLILISSMSDAQNNIAISSQQSRGQEQTTTTPPSVNQSSSASNYYEVDCKRPDNHDAADLCEQRRMAQAAEDLVWWAKVQALIGLLGFGGLLVTLVFTGWGTRAASKQVGLSRESLVLTDRAFVYPVKAVQSPHFDDDKARQRVTNWSIGVEWKNSGNTPTMYLHLMINKEVRATPLPDDFSFPDVATSENTYVLIPPGGTIELVLLPIGMEEVESIISGNQMLFIWGWAEYDDIFKGTRRHRTEFCFRQTLGGDPRKKDGFWGRYHVHHKHNGADEECEFPIRTSSPKDMGGR